MKINDQINREIGVHGRQWNSLHEGYFADAAIAAPFVEAITQYLSGSDTDVIVDLGGGTGFVLLELASRGATAGRIPVNLDCSATQLDVTRKQGLTCVNGLISDFRRQDIAALDKRMFFIMRSVLHYFGREGLTPALSHIRRQARKEEIFIHQTACFESAIDARCINTLYREMGTPKWYPTITELRDSVTGANWQVMDIFPAPALKLTSSELGLRYGLDSPALTKIRNRMIREFGEIDNVFRKEQEGFTAYLHYRICITRAV